MTFEELKALVEKGFITDTNILDACSKDKTLLNKVNFSAYVPQVTSPMDASEVEDELIKDITSLDNVVLKKNTKLSTAIVVTKKMTFDLNGKTLEGGLFELKNGELVEGNTDSYCFLVKKGGELTITGQGSVKTQSADYSIAVWADGGVVNIDGGVYENFGEGSDLIYASNGATINITNGEFKANEKQSGVSGTNNLHSALNIKDKDRKTTHIKVSGGKFYGFDPANNVSEGPNTNFVVEGYESVEVSEGVFEVRPVQPKVEPEVEPEVEPVQDSPVVVEEKVEE